MIIMISPSFSEHSVVVSIKSLFTLPQSLICYNLFCKKICCLCNSIHTTFIWTTIKRIYFLVLQKFQNNCRIFLAFFCQRSCSVFFPIMLRLCVTHKIHFCHTISTPFHLPFLQIRISHTKVVPYPSLPTQSVTHPVPSHPSLVNPTFEMQFPVCDITVPYTYS